MTAPDAQPPAAPEVWWSQDRNAVLVRDECNAPLLLFMNQLFALPADAVRLGAVPASAALDGTTQASLDRLRDFLDASEGSPMTGIERIATVIDDRRHELLRSDLRALLASTPTRTEETEP